MEQPGARALHPSGAAKVREGGGASTTGLPVDLACTRCPLAKGRTQVVPGDGATPAKLVLVGEAPGAEEDKRGRPFVGRAGKLLEGALEDAGLSRAQVFL